MQIPMENALGFLHKSNSHKYLERNFSKVCRLKNSLKILTCVDFVKFMDCRPWSRYVLNGMNRSLKLWSPDQSWFGRTWRTSRASKLLCQAFSVLSATRWQISIASNSPQDIELRLAVLQRKLVWWKVEWIKHDLSYSTEVEYAMLYDRAWQNTQDNCL